jgi:lysine 2,3-aminomutase
MIEFSRVMERPWELFGASKRQWKDAEWQRANSITEARQLQRYMTLTDEQVEMIEETTEHKPMRITPYYLVQARGKDGNPTRIWKNGGSMGDDVNPVFIQSVPTPGFYLFDGGEVDPLGEDAGCIGSIAQRYPMRVALFVNDSANCDVFCTHCQRDRKKRGTGRLGDNLDGEFRYIDDNVNLFEVLYTGGDALTMSYNDLKKFVKRGKGIEHVESIRIATRLFVTRLSIKLANVNEREDDHILRYFLCSIGVMLVLKLSHSSVLRTM